MWTVIANDVERLFDGRRNELETLLHGQAEQDPVSARRELIAWWEARRLRFNLYVGVVGIATWLLVMTAGSAAVKLGEDFEEPIAMIVGPFIYAIFANVFYTFGWVVDTMLYRGKPRVWLYKSGVIFSLVLTSLPGLWAVVAWLITVITGRKLG
jgi:hypothetical protein